MPLEDTLASWIAGIGHEDIPPAIRGRAATMVLDAIASSFAGRATSGRPALETLADRLGGPGDSTVFGGGGLSLVGATLLNGYQVTAATICDVHRPTLCHVTPEVIPAAFAAAEQAGVDGRTFLTAVTIGMEVTVRLGQAFDYPVFRAHGWHAPGVTGAFGAAAAVARILDLDSLRTRHALGFAGGQAAGTFAALGSSGVKFHQARGAVSGLLAALLAESGFDAAEAILTAPDGGLFHAYAEGGLPERLLGGLGETWQFQEISLRRWPAASSIQALIDGMLQLVDREPIDVATVREVRVGLPEGSYRLNGTSGWGDQLSAMQSSRYVAAVVLHDRRLWLDQFAPARTADPVVGDFAATRVRVTVDTALPPAGVSIEVERNDGSVAAIQLAVPRGDPAAPLTLADVEAKLRDAAVDAGMSERADRIAELVTHLDQLGSVAELGAALRAG